MKIVQVDNDVVKMHSLNKLDDPCLWRVIVCDDGNYNKHHTSVRIKPLKNLTVEELTESLNNPKCGFIQITEYQEETE